MLQKKLLNILKAKISRGTVLGIGTGSTVNFFIEELGNLKHHFKGVVSSSNASSEILISKGIEVFSLNDVNEVEFYIDGADEVTPENFLIKGGGGADTREKIVAAASNEFICIIDKTKLVNKLGAFPLPVEVIPESRSMVARKIIAMGGRPVYRNNFLTDQKNHILDIHDIDISDPEKLEKILNNIPGVVDNGIFAYNKPEIVLISD